MEKVTKAKTATKAPKKPRVKKEEPKPVFLSIFDILTDSKFADILSGFLSERTKNFDIERMELRMNKRDFKRGVYIRLFELGIWSLEPMVKEYTLITEKKSKLESTLRTEVSGIVLWAAQKTLDHYENR